MSYLVSYVVASYLVSCLTKSEDDIKELKLLSRQQQYKCVASAAYKCVLSDTMNRLDYLAHSVCNGGRLY